MDCREFRDRHALLIDVRCSALEEREMQAHMRECLPCARHDAVVRRSLILVKNLPTIEPSPNFRARLDARLAAVRLEKGDDMRTPLRVGGRTVAMAAAALAFVLLAANYMIRHTGATEIRMAPVVATIPETESASATRALVATVPTGMSVWPAIMVASQVPIHFVAAELATER